jgi:diguanylate cyclase (GGDEF)-like protein
MLKILRQVENISACRDRDILAASIVAAIRETFPARSVTLLRLNAIDSHRGELVARSDDAGLTVVAADCLDPPESYPIPRELATVFARSTPACLNLENGALCGLPIESVAGTPPSLLLIELDQTLNGEDWEALERFARFYVNYTRLLDDSEQDTLTQLFNRKTFDESFDRLLADDRRLPPPPDQPERRAPPRGDEKRLWLAVADIDLFKKVNDSYGHLFGDEVLIRFAALMKKSFRKSDRLFRFGGEEFVILLKPSTEANIQRILDRFRCAVEAYDFPRVGHVTCSLGFAPIDPQQAPTDIMGRADTALYYAKSHGRNQVRSFTTLVSQGLLAAPDRIADQQPADIDALFG